MHLLENLVGRLLPLYSKSQNYKDFLLNCYKTLIQKFKKMQLFLTVILNY